MRFLLCLMLSLSISSIGRAQNAGTHSDSVDYYRNALHQYYFAWLDSLTNSPEYTRLNSNLLRILAASDSYSAISLFTSIYSADYRQLNADNGIDNFGPMSGPLFSVGYGGSFKKKRRILDVEAVSFGFNKKSVNQDEAIKVSMWSIFRFDWGYDLVRSKLLDLYPYVGLGLRFPGIEYDAPTQTNSSFANVANIVQNNRSATGTSSKIGYQAGSGWMYC